MTGQVFALLLLLVTIVTGYLCQLQDPDLCGNVIIKGHVSLVVSDECEQLVHWECFANTTTITGNFKYALVLSKHNSLNLTTLPASAFIRMPKLQSVGKTMTVYLQVEFEFNSSIAQVPSVQFPSLKSVGAIDLRIPSYGIPLSQDNENSVFKSLSFLSASPCTSSTEFSASSIPNSVFVNFNFPVLTELIGLPVPSLIVDGGNLQQVDFPELKSVGTICILSSGLRNLDLLASVENINSGATVRILGNDHMRQWGSGMTHLNQSSIVDKFTLDNCLRLEHVPTLGGLAQINSLEILQNDQLLDVDFLLNVQLIRAVIANNAMLQNNMGLQNLRPTTRDVQIIFFGNPAMCQGFPAPPSSHFSIPQLTPDCPTDFLRDALTLLGNLKPDVVQSKSQRASTSLFITTPASRMVFVPQSVRSSSGQQTNRTMMVPVVVNVCIESSALLDAVCQIGQFQNVTVSIPNLIPNREYDFCTRYFIGSIKPTDFGNLRQVFTLLSQALPSLADSFPEVEYEQSKCVVMKTEVSIYELQCPAGQARQFPSKDCAACPPGTFKPGRNQLDCFSCPPGTYSSKQGATDYSDCVPCKNGTYSSLPAQSRCAPCHPDFCQNFGSVRKFAPTVERIAPRASRYSVKDASSDSEKVVLVSIYMAVALGIAILLGICVFIMKKFQVSFVPWKRLNFLLVAPKAGHKELHVPFTQHHNSDETFVAPVQDHNRGWLTVLALIFICCFAGYFIHVWLLDKYSETRDVVPGLTFSNLSLTHSPHVHITLNLIEANFDCHPACPIHADVKLQGVSDTVTKHVNCSLSANLESPADINLSLQLTNFTFDPRQTHVSFFVDNSTGQCPVFMFCQGLKYVLELPSWFPGATATLTEVITPSFPLHVVNRAQAELLVLPTVYQNFPAFELGHLQTQLLPAQGLFQFDLLFVMPQFYVSVERISLQQLPALLNTLSATVLGLTTTVLSIVITMYLVFFRKRLNCCSQVAESKSLTFDNPLTPRPTTDNIQMNGLGETLESEM
eukprot:m.92543 g.92543  ORF g.92543 m.92543 type:complete len:1017 (-) comp21727_c0_seq1:23-3073(-)